MKKLTLEEVIEGIEDTRRERSVWHDMKETLIIILLGVICGATSYAKIEIFAEGKKEWLGTFLKLENGIPGAYTMRRIMMSIDSGKLHERFIEWMKGIVTELSGVMAIDGKTSRRTKDSDKKALHTVSAFAYERGLVLGQIACEEHSNEITAIPELLKMLEFKGCIVTIDAMGCQTDIAEVIIGKESDYVLAVKENQELLYNDIKLYTETEILPIPASERPAGQYHRTINKGHGRIEIRKYYICNDISWLECSKWVGISGFGLCVSSVEEKGVTTVSHRYYIYSVKDMTAQKFAYCCRNHWSVENNLHWVLDVVFREDDSRARKDNSAENFNVFRHFAYNLLKAESSFKSSIPNKQFKCLFDNDYLWKVFSACS